MKAHKKLTLTALMSSVLLIAYTGNVQAQTPETAATKTVLNVGSDMTFPPYEYLEDGVAKGLDVDLMAKMAELDGTFKPDWKDTRWANLIPGLKGKRFDVLFSSMYITKERLEQIDMIPYYKTDISLLVRNDSEYQPKGPNDLCGKVVGAMKGTAFATQVADISEQRCVANGKPGITIREYETSPQTTQALLARAVDVQYDDAAVMLNATKNLSGRVKVTSTEEFFPIVGGIGIRKGDTETYKKIEESLNKMKASGDFERILSSYGLKAPTEEDIAKVMN